MRKIIKQIGNTLGITFDKEEQRIFGLAKGDIIELDDMLIQDKHGRKK